MIDSDNADQRMNGYIYRNTLNIIGRWLNEDGIALVFDELGVSFGKRAGKFNHSRR